MFVEIYTDGSASVNNKPGGYGWVIVIDGEKHSEGSGYMPTASNNDAELEAAINGLYAAKTLLEQKTLNNPKFTLVSDSQLILGWVTGRYSFRQEDKLSKFKELKLLANLLDLKTRWVEGHNGDLYNEICDRLANQARISGQNKKEKIKAMLEGRSIINRKKTGIVCVWYKNKLKVIDLEQNIIEDYNREQHGSRGGILEIREEKSR